MKLRDLFPPTTLKPLCELCHGNGWLESASLDGYSSPGETVFVQKCGACERYSNDTEAAKARHAQGHGEYVGVVCGKR
jgi:hypothetical protein